MKTRPPAIFACVLLAGCTGGQELHGTTPAVPAAITPTELIAEAHGLRGHTTTVVGFFTWRTDTSALWESKDALLDAEQQRKGAKFDYWGRCVTVYPLKRDARRLSNRQVRVTGTVSIISDTDMRSLWTCNRVALEGASITPEYPNVRTEWKADISD